MPNKTFDYGELRVTVTSAYRDIWLDFGTGAKRDVHFWLPTAQDDLKPLGAVGISNHGDINGMRGSLLVGLNPDKTPTGGKPAVAPPTGYTIIWRSDWTGVKNQATNHCSIWRPDAPDGYVSCGDLAWGGFDTPGIDQIWCLRADLARRADFKPNSLWDDSTLNVSCWDVIPLPVGQDGAEYLPILADVFRFKLFLDRPSSDIAYVPALKAENNFKPFDVLAPKITPKDLPTKDDVIHSMDQCEVTLPFVALLSPTDSTCLQLINDPFITVKRSIAWVVEAVWENDAETAYQRSRTMKYGVSQTQSDELTHNVGIDISAKGGIGIVETSIKLNYQFTYKSSSSFTEYTESTVTDNYEIGPYTATVLFSKHIWIRGVRTNGKSVIAEIQIVSDDDVHLSGCSLLENSVSR